MLTTLLQIFLGFLLSGTGAYLGYLFLTGIADGPETILLILSFVLLTTGIILFIRAAKSTATIGVKQISMTTDVPKDEKGFEQMIERNNAMEQDWGKTNKTRNQLKVLQASDESQ